MNDTLKWPTLRNVAHLVGAYLAVAVGGLLLGRAAIYGVLFPFLPAFVASLTTASPVAVVAAAAAGLFGLYRTWGPYPALASGVALLPLALWPAVRRGTASSTLVTLVAGTGAALGLAFTAYLQGRGPEAYWLAGFQGLFAAGLAVAYRPAVTSLGRHQPVARAGVNRLALISLMASAAAGLDGLYITGVSPGAAMGAALTAGLAMEGGVGYGAAAGALFATVTSLGRGIDPAEVGTLALAGMAAGQLRGLGRAGVVAGVLIGVLAGSYTSRPVEALTALLGSSLLGAVAGVLIPIARFSALLGDLRVDAALPSERTGAVDKPDRGIQKLKALARLFSELSHAFGETETASSSPSAASAEPSGQARGRTAEDAREATLTGHELAPVVEAVATRVCQGCDLQRTCWQTELYRTYRNLGEAWAAAEDQGGITPGRFPEDFRRQCIHPADMAAAINQVLDLVRLSRYWERKTTEGRELVAAQLLGVAQIMQGLAESASASPEAPARRAGAVRHGRQTVACQIGVSRASKGGAPVSGDTVLHRQLDESLLVAALSDGMGAGPRAAQESRVTVDMLERLLEAGFPPDVAVRTINSILLLRSADEVFATLDLMLLRLDTGEADFLKTGAAPSFIRRGNRVSVVKSSSLPAGILTQIEVPLTRHLLKPGDLLVMVTDGLLSDLGETQVAEFLQRFPRQEPQLVAEALLNLALEGRQGKPADDVTVLAVLLTHPAQPEANPAAGWAAVKWRPIAPPRKRR